MRNGMAKPFHVGYKVASQLRFRWHSNAPALLKLTGVHPGGIKVEMNPYQPCRLSMGVDPEDLESKRKAEGDSEKDKTRGFPQ
jgi:hypothetical protein